MGYGWNTLAIACAVLLPSNLKERSVRVSITCTEASHEQAASSFSGTKKVAMLKRHLFDTVPVSEMRDELDIYPNELYGWLKGFFENGHTAFGNGRKPAFLTQDSLQSVFLGLVMRLPR